MENSFDDTGAIATPSADQITTKVSQGRFDESLYAIVREIMDEVLTTLDWWAGQIWWFMPAGFEPGNWQTGPGAPINFALLAGSTFGADSTTWPEEIIKELTLISIDDATWLPNRSQLKRAGVRSIVVIDIIANDRPSVRLVFVVPSASALTVEAKLFLTASALLLPKMVIRERARTELHFRATHDALTGLLNRRGLNQLLEMQPTAKKNLRAVLFLDINKFKDINDTHGHEIGDELLHRVAKQLSSQIRPTDAVARIGGDEFVVIAAEVASAAGAAIFAKRLWGAVASSYKFANGASWHGSASIGVAIWHPGEKYVEVLRRADMLMYRAKNNDGGIEVESDRPAVETDSSSASEPISISRIFSLTNSASAATQVSVETLLRSPDAAHLAGLIAAALAETEQEVDDIWLKLPKSFWLDGDRITALLDALISHSVKAHISLVIASENASYEARMVAREIKEQYSVDLVVGAFGSGARDLELLALLEPSALVIDSHCLDRGKINPAKPEAFQWAEARSVLAICNELGIKSVAPSEANDTQTAILAKLGCNLKLETK